MFDKTEFSFVFNSYYKRRILQRSSWKFLIGKNSIYLKVLIQIFGLKMSQIGLTESVKGDARRFEIWLQGRAEVHTIQAPSVDAKQSWVRQIKGVLMSQLAELKGKQSSALGKTNHKYVHKKINSI